MPGTCTFLLSYFHFSVTMLFIVLISPNALNLLSIASFTVIIYFCPRQQQVMIFCELCFEVAVMQSV